MELIRGALLFAAIFLDVCAAQNATSRIYQGFNSGNTLTDYTAKFEADFVKEFTTMQNLSGTNGAFTSVRLYTNIQAYTTSDVLQAIPAALKTNTSILLGIWTSGTNNITNELDALQKAIDEYGQAFADAVIGLSVGSEDLYRYSEIGIRQGAGIGAGPEDIVRFIEDARRAIEGTPLANKPVGHVDTWRSFTNESNTAVIEASDFLGVSIYPFFENDTTITPGYVNTFDNAVPIFEDRYQKVLDASQNKPVWIAETGWPSLSEGPAWGESTASVEQQRDYWRAVGCSKLFGQVSTWWYTLRDANPDSKQKFAITDKDVERSTFDLSCAAGASNETTYSSDARPGPRSVFGLARALLMK